MGSEDHDRKRMSDIVERLELQAFVADKIQSGMKPLIMDCLNEITRLRAEHKMAFEAVGDVVKANDDLRAENEKLRNEVMSDYHEGWEEGVKAERERIACKFDSRPHDFWSGEAIAAAIRESGDE